jgi:hypothetical protein
MSAEINRERIEMNTVSIRGKRKSYTVREMASGNDITWKFGDNISMDVQEIRLDYLD